MKNLVKRFLAIALVVAVILSFSITSASAIDQSYINSLTAA